MDGQQQQQSNISVGLPTSSAEAIDYKMMTTTSTFIIGADSLHINKELGVGEFGVVQQGVWCSPESKRIQVAIKCLSSQRFDTSRLEFLKEARIMHNISHEHIVRLYGVVLEPSLMLVTELALLRSLLECLKDPSLVCQFPVITLCNFAAQIADGMSYLEHQCLIHRDLAARNILIFGTNMIKISDIGLSAALCVNNNYYYNNMAWIATEVSVFFKFTSMSDCWAYGVCLWEMFSYGFQPWADLTGQQILEAIDEPSYQRLEQPECCPRKYYALMLRCWQHEPTARPRFAEIVSILPDCLPVLVQAVKICESSTGDGGAATAGDYNTTGTTSNSNVSTKVLLDYKIGDIITVLDKSVLNNGKTGYFNPSDSISDCVVEVVDSDQNVCQEMLALLWLVCRMRTVPPVSTPTS
ncbi:activated Cdc42 kinase-like [Oppia nitens]|uniref:activated Cdc42 kinase-like n=1 Tax=Oppia nitens TaxID=1686743 RepID=UPI0023DADC3B|nr:activated Cdc42 kinase-like [Oppia nitens]XP_054157145.1 activated Cdc42 kinase-like [Oppia nitens]